MTKHAARRRLDPPVRMTTANLDFVTSWRHDLEHLVHLTGVVGALVLFCQEAKNLRGKHSLANLLGNLFSGLQGTTIPTAGTALYARGIRLHGMWQWLAGKAPATLARWVTRGRIRVPGGQIVLLSVHIYPLRSGPEARAAYVAELVRRVRRIEAKGYGWVIGCDANMRLPKLAEQLGGNAYHRGIVGFITSKDVIVTAAGLDTFGLDHGDTDHPAAWIDVAGLR